MAKSGMQLIMDDIRKIQREVYYDPKIDCIVLNVLFEYQIGMDQIRNKRDIVRWVIHLLPKGWVKKRHLEAFIGIACSQLGLSPYDSGDTK